jgi:hypothetical protein
MQHTENNKNCIKIGWQTAFSNLQIIIKNQLPLNDEEAQSSQQTLEKRLRRGDASVCVNRRDFAFILDHVANFLPDTVQVSLQAESGMLLAGRWGPVSSHFYLAHHSI